MTSQTTRRYSLSITRDSIEIGSGSYDAARVAIECDARLADDADDCYGIYEDMESDIECAIDADPAAGEWHGTTAGYDWSVVAPTRGGTVATE